MSFGGWQGGRIRIGASTPKKWNPLSPIIRRVLGTTYSHVWILIEDAFMDLDFVLETSAHGLVFVPYDDFVKKNKVTTIYDPSPSYHLEVGVRALLSDFLDRPYDALGLFGMLWVKIGQWLKHKWRNPLSSSREMFCSESVAFVLVKASVPEAALLVPSATDPRQVIQIVSSMQLS